MIAALGLWQAGAVLVPINTRFKGAEAVLLLNGSGNREERKFRDPDRFDIHRTIDHHPRLRLRHSFLSRRGAGEARGTGRARRGPEAVLVVGGRL
jgi:hypothetical protein